MERIGSVVRNVYRRIRDGEQVSTPTERPRQTRSLGRRTYQATRRAPRNVTGSAPELNAQQPPAYEPPPMYVMPSPEEEERRNFIETSQRLRELEEQNELPQYQELVFPLQNERANLAMEQRTNPFEFLRNSTEQRINPFEFLRNRD
jgi:hypothetical protein